MSKQSATLEFDEAGFVGDSQWAFRLRPGEMLLIEAAGVPDWQVRNFGDLACGICPPGVGRVFFMGNDWAGMRLSAAESARGKIGRVFLGAAWVSNLDVDENVLLAARHHTSQPDGELLAEAERLAFCFGIRDGLLPGRRPSLVGAADLQRAQLVRALLPKPCLLILESPFEHLEKKDRLELADEISKLRIKGTAVILIVNCDGDRGCLGNDLGHDLCLNMSWPRVASATTVVSPDRRLNLSFRRNSGKNSSKGPET